MYVELPQITRCCFCFPLRYGLRVWGYIKVILQVTLIIFAVVKSWTYLVTYNFMTVLSIILLLIILDVIFGILLVIATHKKNEKLFKIYYTYSMVVAVLFICTLFLNLGFIIVVFTENFVIGLFMLHVVGANFVSILATLLLQGYITLLVRSELMKLRDRSNIQFFNLTIEGSEQKVTVNIPKGSTKGIELV